MPMHPELPPSRRSCPGCGAQLAFHRQLCDACRDGNGARRRARQRADYEPKKTRLEYTYALTPEGFARLLAEQDGKCPVCGSPLSFEPNVPAYHRPQVDHDHRCCPGMRVKCGGRCVRGIIHGHCNRGLGQLGDDPDVYLRAAEYVRRANERLGLEPIERAADAAH